MFWSYYRATGKLRRVLYMALPEDEKDLSDSRRSYVVSEAANQSLAQLSAGTFLVAALTSLGLSDGTIGTILSVTMLTTLFDLFTMNYVQRLRKRKGFVCVMVLQKVWFAFVYFIPLFDWPAKTRIFWFVLLYSFAQLTVQISTPAINDWIADLVPKKTRGAFLARKDAIAVFATVTSMLVMGIVVDRFPDDNHRQSFPIMGAVILALALLNTAAFLRMKEARTLPKDAQGKEMHGALLRRYDARQHSRKASTLQEIRSAFGHEGFRKALILNCIWNAAFYVAQPFNASYQLKELKLSYSLIMIITFGCSLIRVALTPAIGKRGDRRGMGRTLCHVFLLYILGNVFLMLAVPGNALPMFMASSLCTSISWAFIGIGMFCIQLELLDPRKRTLQMSIITALSGTFAFLVSALAGRLIDYLQSYPVRIANVQLYAQQVTNFLGILATAAVILYLWFIVCRVEKQTPEADA